MIVKCRLRRRYVSYNMVNVPLLICCRVMQIAITVELNTLNKTIVSIRPHYYSL